MKLKRLTPALAALGFLAACGGPGGGSADYERSPAPPPPAPVMEEAANFGGVSKMAAADQSYSEPAPVPDRPDAEPGAEQYIAYSHSLGLRLPAAWRRRADDAGPYRCLQGGGHQYLHHHQLQHLFL